MCSVTSRDMVKRSSPAAALNAIISESSNENDNNGSDVEVGSDESDHT